MNNKFIFFIFLSNLAFTSNLYTQDVRAHTIGIVVRDIQLSTNWYEEILDLKLFKEMSFPEYDSLRINFLKGEHIQLELLEKANTFSIRDYVPEYSINDKPLIGFSKIAFEVEDIRKFKEKTKQLKAREITGIIEDAEFNSLYFIIEDPDGNILQFIENKND